MWFYDALKDFSELLYFLTAPVLVFFAYRMLEQLKIGGEQVKTAADQIITSKKISDIHAKRESMRIAAEQSIYFAEKIIPDIDKFLKLKTQNKYPILSRAIIVENWPDIQSKTDDLPGLVDEVFFKNGGLVIKTLNRIEGFAMFFTCGIADANLAYGPLSASFCDYIKTFLPYLAIANEQHKQFSNILKLYVAWGTRKHVEDMQKEISKQKEHLSKIKVPDLKPFGTDTEC